MTRKHPRPLSMLGVLTTLVLIPATGPAQQPVDSRWLPWLGCWQIGTEPGAAPGNLLVCLRPASASDAVEVATIRDGEVASTRTLVADGQPHAVQGESCSGSQFAQFSSDGRRVYLWSTLSCEGGLKRTASAIMALASPTEWLDVQALGVNGKRVPRAVRYKLAPEQMWPAGFAMGAQRAATAADARLVASGKLALADIQEASSSVDQEALATFVLEWDKPFELSASKLTSLADAGVPADVTDAVVAVSYPTRFIVDRAAGSLALAPTPQREPRYSGRNLYADPYGWGWWDAGSYYGGLGYWSSYCGSTLYGLSGLGFGGYLPYWYNPYGYGYWGQPIIVVNGGDGQAAHGALVRGRGYTRGGEPAGSAGGRYAHPRGGSPAPDRSGGSYAPSAASAGARSSGGSVSPGGYSHGSGSSSSSGSSSGTAKPKCCS